jgi:hypothetical protein
VKAYTWFNICPANSSGGGAGDDLGCCSDPKLPPYDSKMYTKYPCRSDVLGQNATEQELWNEWGCSNRWSDVMDKWRTYRAAGGGPRPLSFSQEVRTSDRSARLC